MLPITKVQRWAAPLLSRSKETPDFQIQLIKTSSFWGVSLSKVDTVNRTAKAIRWQKINKHLRRWPKNCAVNVRRKGIFRINQALKNLIDVWRRTSMHEMIWSDVLKILLRNHKDREETIHTHSVIRLPCQKRDNYTKATLHRAKQIQKRIRDSLIGFWFRKSRTNILWRKLGQR